MGLEKLELIAVEGYPRDCSGSLKPIFRMNKGAYFIVGGNNFNQDELDELIRDEACIPFEPIDVTGRFNVSDLKSFTGENNPSAYSYPFSAYVMYFSNLAMSNIGLEHLREISLLNNGIPLSPIHNLGLKDYGSFLLRREALVGRFIPEIINLCGKRIDLIVSQREQLGLKYIVSGNSDSAAILAQVMMTISSEDTLEKAISYYGRMLLLSPLSSNFDNWLNFVCKRNGLNERNIRKKYFTNISS